MSSSTSFLITEWCWGDERRRVGGRGEEPTSREGEKGLGFVALMLHELSVWLVEAHSGLSSFLLYICWCFISYDRALAMVSRPLTSTSTETSTARIVTTTS